MSSRKFINNGDYQIRLDNGRLIVSRPGADQGTAAIEISSRGQEPSGYLGVTNGALKYGFDDSIPFDVFHEGRPPDISELTFLDEDSFLGRVSSVLYVSPSGRDSNTGESLGEPKRTIRSAVAAAERIQSQGMGFVLATGQTQTDYPSQFTGGSGYNLNDTITLTNQAEVTVTAVSGGAVTGFEIISAGEPGVLPDRDILRDTETTAAGSGFSLQPRERNATPTKDRPPVKIFVKTGRYSETGPITLPRRVSLWGDSLRSTFVSPATKPREVAVNWLRNRLRNTDPAWLNEGVSGAYAAEIDAEINTIRNDLQAEIDASWSTVFPGSLASRVIERLVDVAQAIGRDLSTPTTGTGPNNIRYTNGFSFQSSVFFTSRAVSRLLESVSNPQLAGVEALLTRLETSLLALSGTSLEFDIVSDFLDRARESVNDITVTADPSHADALLNSKQSLESRSRVWLGQSANVPNGAIPPETVERLVRITGDIVRAVSEVLLEGGRPQFARVLHRIMLIANSDPNLRVWVQNLLIHLSESTATNSASANLIRALAVSVGEPVEWVSRPIVRVTVASGTVTDATVAWGGHGYSNRPSPSALFAPIRNSRMDQGPVRRLMANRELIERVVGDYARVTYAPLMTPEQADLCERDVGYVLDAIIADLRDGGTRNTQHAAESYFLSSDTALPADQVTASQDTFSRIARLAWYVVRNESIVPMYNGQNLSLFPSQKFPANSDVSTALADFLTGATELSTIPLTQRGIIGNLINALNDTLGNPVYQRTFGNVRVLDPFSTDTPVLSFVTDRGSLQSVTVTNGGTVSLADGDYDVSDCVPQPHDTLDLFYVNDGCYLSGMTFNNLRGEASAVAFDPEIRDPLEPLSRKGLITTSPYVQNCSAINIKEQGGVGMKINGRYVSGLRSMVSDAFTQINTGGKGVHLSNRGYAQLVSIFTVSTDKAIFTESGGQCSVTNSNSSFGNMGLVSRGLSEELTSGTALNQRVNQGLTHLQVDSDQWAGGRGYAVAETIRLLPGLTVTVDAVDGTGGVTEFTVTESESAVLTNRTLEHDRGFMFTPRPADVGASGDPIPVNATQFVLNNVSARPPAFGDAVWFDQEFTGAQDNSTWVFAGLGLASARQDQEIEISVNGEPVAHYDWRIVSRAPDLTIVFTGFSPLFGSTVTARLKTHRTVVATHLDGETGHSLIELDTGITLPVDPGTTARLYQRSLITSSSHTFEYVGSGTDMIQAVPSAGGQPIRANEIVGDPNGAGSVYFTSTDDQGDFRIGPELTINRSTGTITGEAFERSLFAVLTPYILSLEN